METYEILVTAVLNFEDTLETAAMIDLAINREYESIKRIEVKNAILIEPPNAAQISNNIDSIKFCNCHVSVQLITQLQQSMPNLQIEWDTSCTFVGENNHSFFIFAKTICLDSNNVYFLAIGNWI